MRKYAYIVPVAILMLAGCARTEIDCPRGAEMIELSFEAGLESSSRLKTCISASDSGKVVWSPDEQISLLYPDADGTSFVYRLSRFTSTNQDTSSVANFQGTITRSQFFGNMEQMQSSPLEYFAVYPYDDSSVVQDNAIVLRLGKTQTASEGSISDGQFPSVAHTVDSRLNFWNVCGGVTFTLVNSGVKSVSFSSVGKVPLSGTVKVRFNGDTGVPEIESFVSDTSSTVTLRAPDNSTFVPGVRYYMALPPCTLPGGFIVTLRKASSKAEIVRTASVTVKRSVFGKIDGIDKDAEFVDVPVQSVELDTASIELMMKGTYTLEASVGPEEAPNKDIVWTSSDEGVATVSDAGVVTAVAEGTCIITATSEANPEAYDICEVTVTGIGALDRGSSYANCYIVTAPGVYEFAPVRGVSGAALSGVAEAKVLWEFVSVSASGVKAGDILDSVEIVEGRIRLTTPSTLKDGSAVVAVLDGSGNILWSWHIWVVSGYDIDDESILCSNGEHLMGRHLGSVSSQKNTPLGLVYQWGRKDPFPATIYPNYCSSSTGWTKVASDSSTGTVEYVTGHPQTFITSDDNDWYYASDDMKENRWTSSGKTDYDPCPYGWEVPSNEFWSDAIDETASHNWDIYGVGIDMAAVLGISGKLCWFQSTGYMQYDYAFNASSNVMELWACDYSSRYQQAYYMAAGSFFFYKSSVTYPANGLSVRCVKEE